MALPPLTTIVVINHNYARFLREAVQSALGQTRPATVLVIDDASTDDSVAVIDSLRAQDPSIAATCLHDNIGLSLVRNLAASIATTEWVVHLDADDWLEPTYVERGEGSLSSPSGRADVVTFDMTLLRGHERRRVVRSRIPRDWRELLHRNTIVQTSLVRRSMVEALGGYDPSLDFEDWDFWIRVLQSGGTIARVPEALVNRREHGANKSKLCDERAAVAAIRRKHSAA